MRGLAAVIATVMSGTMFIGACSAPESDPFVDLSTTGAEASTVGGAQVADPVSSASSVPAPSTSMTESTATTTIAPLVDLVVPSVPGAIETATAAFGETVTASIECLTVPAVCDPATVAIPGGPAHERYARLVAVFDERGLVVRRIAELSRWTVESAIEGPAPEVVVAVVCDVDADEVVQPAASTGLGMDLTINDEMVARRVRVELRRTGAGWRRWSVEQLGEWPMEASCASA